MKERLEYEQTHEGKARTLDEYETEKTYAPKEENAIEEG